MRLDPGDGVVRMGTDILKTTATKVLDEGLIAPSLDRVVPVEAHTVPETKFRRGELARRRSHQSHNST